MVLEATMLLLDNSDWSRNGDYQPTRWEAQYDAASMIGSAKFQDHPESAVGLITMAGKQVEVLLTPTNENEKLLAALYGIPLKGRISLKNSIAIAQLALKHRMNKNQRQRIIVFIASPVSEDENTLIQLAKKLRKNSVAVDIINIGELGELHVQKLEKFIQTVNSSENSHFFNILPGMQQLADQLIGTSIMGGHQINNQNLDQGMGQNPNNNNNNEDFGGIDPNMDPEMAMALRMSIEDEKERLRRLQEQKDKDDKEKMDEEGKPKEPKEEEVKVDNEQNQDNEEDMEDELIKQAKIMSLEDDGKVVEPKKEIQDKQFMSDLLGLIPDLDKANPDLQKTMEELGIEKDNKKDNKPKEDDKK